MSDLESISEHIPSKLDSLSASENVAKSAEPQSDSIANQDLCAQESDVEKSNSSINLRKDLKPSEKEYSQTSSHSTTSLDIEPPLINDDADETPHNLITVYDIDTLKQEQGSSNYQCLKESSNSWLNQNSATESHNISNESPVNLPLSSELSKATETKQDEESKSSGAKISTEKDSNDSITNSDGKLNTDDFSSNETLEEPSLSNSEEIIKLDIRGTCAPKMKFPVEKIFFGLPPEDSQMSQPNLDQVPVFPSFFQQLVGEGDNNALRTPKKGAKEPYSSTPKLEAHPLDHNFETAKCDENDLLVEEIIVEDEMVNKEPNIQLKMDEIPVEMKEELSFSTMATEYKTLCDDLYHEKVEKTYWGTYLLH